MIRRPTISTLIPYTTLFRSNIQKENTFNNVGEDTELLEPSKATKSLLKDSNMKVNNPDVIKMLNESSIQPSPIRSEEHTSELQSRGHIVCRLLLEKNKMRRI